MKVGDVLNALLGRRPIPPRVAVEREHIRAEIRAKLARQQLRLRALDTQVDARASLKVKHR